MNVKEEDLIEYIKPLLKAQGFKKKAKRWTKVTDHFTYIFFIQGKTIQNTLLTGWKYASIQKVEQCRII